MRVALAIARAIAAARGDTDTTATHIALGLLREAENGAVAALQHGDVPLDDVRGALEVELGQLGRTRPDEVVLPLTDGERRVMEGARVQADLRGDRFIAPEHVLLGILRDELSPAARAFASYGFEYAGAVRHVEAVVLRHHRPPGPRAVG